MDKFTFAAQVQEAGGAAYQVGGSIRDLVLGITPKDIDFCVTGFTEESFLELFPSAYRVGAAFPVFLLEIGMQMCEVAFARTEKKISEGHKGFEVFSSPHVTIQEDLSRRDFTMNAMAYDLSNHKYIDPFHGQVDIHQRMIRATGEAFKEDPLRVYRAARFAAQLGFRIDRDTCLMMNDVALHEEMKTLSAERVTNELEKALRSSHPANFFETLRHGGSLHVHFKEIHDLIGVEQSAEHHPEGDAYVHTMQVLSEMSKLSDRTELRFAALTHDLGKALTPKELWPKHHGHEEAGLQPIREMCRRIKAPTKWKQVAKFGAVNHMRFHIIDQMKDVKKVDLIEMARKSPIGVEGFALLGLADRLGRGGLHSDHPNYLPFLHWANLISTVKGNKELEGLKAWDDKRKRQAALIRNHPKEEL